MAKREQCTVKDLPRGDCSQLQENLGDGQYSEYCSYHRRVFDGTAAPFIEEMYGRDSNGFFPLKVAKREVA